MRRPVVLIAVALAAIVLGADGRVFSQQPETPPQFRGAVDVIQLDVSVLDKNRRPIRGLTAENFTVTEDGKPQRIVTTAEIDAAERDPALSAWMRHVPRDIASNDLIDQAGDGRLFGIVLDDNNTPYDDPAAETALRTAARYIVDGLGPSDLAAIVYVQDAGKTQDFTDDREKLLAAIDKFQAHMPEWVGPTPIGPGPGGGDMVQRFAPSMARTRCQRTQPAIPTLDTVVARLAIVPQRRKTLIFLGPGVPISFGVGGGCQSELSEMMKDLFWKAQRGNVNIYGIDPLGYQGYEDALVQRMIRQGRANGLDTQRVASNAARLRHDFLEVVADNTGGRAVVNTDNIEQSVDAIFDEDGSYYLVGYQTSNGKPDGKFRRVQVKVNVPGATVRTRSGYWATRAGGLTATRENENPTTLDLGLAGMESPTGLPLRAAATPVGPAATGAGSAREADVAIVLTVRVPSPKQAAPETLTIVRNVYDADNHTGPPAQDIIKTTLAPTAGDDLRYDVWQHLRLAPGRYQIRLNAHSAVLDRGGTVYADVEVPDFSQSAITLTPIVLGAKAAGDTPRADALASILPIVPTTARDFSPSEHVTAYLRVVQGGTGAIGPVALSVQVLDPHSAVVFETSNRLAADAFDAGRTAAYQLDLPLEGRSHGPHLLSISAKLPDGRTSRRDFVFRVR